MNNYRSKRSKSLTLCCGLTLCCVVLVAASLSGQTDTTQVPYPDGYRNWAHVKTALIQEGSPAFGHWGRFRHIYGNAKAMEGYKAGKFDDGSILVFDVLEAVSKDNVINEGKRRLIDVMVRDEERIKFPQIRIQ